MYNVFLFNFFDISIYIWSNDISPLYIVLKEENLEFMKFLLQQKGIKADFKDSTGIF